MPKTASGLRERQNNEPMLLLLRAMSASHGRVQRLNSLRMLLAVLIAVSGILATLIPAVAMPISAVGAAWALAYAVGLASWSSSELRRAAVLQEMFDVRLFGLPWNSVAVGEPVGAHEISRLAQRYKHGDGELRDYYEIPDLPSPYEILACQQQNLGWGARVRRRYAYSTLCGVVAWVGVGVIIGGVFGLNVAELAVRWYVPSLGVLLLGVDTYRGQRGVAAERERVLSIVGAHISLIDKSNRFSAEARQRLLAMARQIQDVLFQTRVRQPRVPNLFFLKFRAGDRTDFQAGIRDLVSTLGA